jgi:hypothetical protein
MLNAVTGGITIRGTPTVANTAILYYVKRREINEFKGT